MRVDRIDKVFFVDIGQNRRLVRVDRIDKVFFVDIGQNLAKNIEPPSENVTVENYLGNCNTQSIFPSSVEESEITNIV